MAKRRVKIARDEVVRRFASRLRQFRESIGVSQTELAERAGIAKSYLWRLENAQTCPGIDLVQKLATALGTTTATLLTGESATEVETLRDQVRQQSVEVIERVGHESLQLLSLLLARLR